MLCLFRDGNAVRRPHPVPTPPTTYLASSPTLPHIFFLQLLNAITTPQIKTKTTTPHPPHKKIPTRLRPTPRFPTNKKNTLLGEDRVKNQLEFCHPEFCLLFKVFVFIIGFVCISFCARFIYYGLLII